jgi:hypothetical protein
LKKNVEPVQQTSIEPFAFVCKIPRPVDFEDVGRHRLVGVLCSTSTSTPVTGCPVELFFIVRNMGADAPCVQNVDVSSVDVSTGLEDVVRSADVELVD